MTLDHVRHMLTSDPRRALRKLPISTPLLDRVVLRCRLDDSGCWIFTGSLTKGYGTINARSQGVRAYAHHVTFDSLVGRSRAGLWTDHLCRNPACANPWHLELVPPGENTRRGSWASGLPRATHCKAGHAYAEVGVYLPPGGGLRKCRRCQDRWIAAQSKRRREARAQRRVA